MASHEDLSRTHDVKASSNKAFGWVFTAAFLVIGFWPLVSGRPVRVWALVVAAVFLVATLVAPALLALPNRLWAKVGVLMNRIVSPVVLAFLFYAVVTPMGALMRAFGKDSMRLRGRGASSHWIKRDPPGPKPDSMSNQF
ncbi:MAG TPA: SxtJ family membrane protein [Casimicrobiaceae bacterium]|nr:SxtJ family membrane protein [Casimicrobiaceae bacterium]